MQARPAGRHRGGKNLFFNVGVAVVRSVLIKWMNCAVLSFTRCSHPLLAHRSAAPRSQRFFKFPWHRCLNLWSSRACFFEALFKYFRVEVHENSCYFADRWHRENWKILTNFSAHTHTHTQDRFSVSKKTRCLWPECESSCKCVFSWEKSPSKSVFRGLLFFHISRVSNTMPEKMILHIA